MPLRITSYSDADFAADKDDRKSIIANVIYVNGIIEGWNCKKQGTVALSTAEAEFVAAGVGGREALGLKELFEEFDAIKQLESEASAASSEHVDVKLKFSKDYAKNGTVKPAHVASGDMMADLLTKILNAPRFMELRKQIGLK
uniref:AlNc14C104G6145 protein n=1 Tax=Albugo laibachii Nc14 TaxID=890382 RepID=F0WHT8_9STRA|nr:AlNc14C104G6145 [Albugo laibachii Nc14]|eukprot:CCA20813.1 AlNc14C104G6145 [Albugo laibachii Nc14]